MLPLTKAELPSLVIAALSGALSVAAFAPFEFWWLMIGSFAVLAWLIRDAQPGVCFRLGFAWGLGLYLVGVSWVYVSLNVYGGMPFWMGSFAVLAFCSLLAIFCAMPCWLAARLTVTNDRKNADPRWLRMALLVAFWVVFEWSKSWVLTGFPWLDVGYTQTSSWLFNLAPVGGVYLVGFAVCAIAAALAIGVHARASKHTRIALLTMVGLLFLVSAGLSKVEWSVDYGDPIAVGIVQPNTLIETKWQAAYRDEVISRLAGESANLVSNTETPAQLIVWPETALALSYQQTDDQFWRALVPPDAALISGLVDLPNPEQSYNAAILVCDGEQTLYRKRHLVPFGEYLPLRFLFNWVLEYLELPMSDFSAWQAPQHLTCGDQLKIGLSICYEDAFANEHRIHNGDSSLLVNISEDAWFGDSLAPHQRLQMAQMRAFELSRPMVRSANSGPSAFIDHNGRVLQKSPQFEATSLLHSVQPRSGNTLFQRFGNWIVWFCLALIGVVSLSRARAARTAH